MTLRSNKEKVKTSREELGKYFYVLSNSTYIGLVIGTFITLLTNSVETTLFVCFLTIGVYGTIILAIIANFILRTNKY